MLALFYKVHPDYGTRLSKAVGVPINQAKLWYLKYLINLLIEIIE